VECRQDTEQGRFGACWGLQWDADEVGRDTHWREHIARGIPDDHIKKTFKVYVLDSALQLKGTADSRDWHATS